jgi:hypothetical protein
MDIDIVEEINAKIAVHEAEIAKLKSALAVFVKIMGKPSGDKAAKAVKALPAPKKSGMPLLTVRKIRPEGEKPPRAERSPVDWKDTVLNVLIGNGRPLRSGDIAEMLKLNGPENKREKQSMYNALSSHVTHSKMLRRDQQGFYHLIKHDQGEAQNGVAHAGQPSSETGSAPPRDGSSAEAA